MTLYVVRQQDGGYAVFDDTVPGFCGYGMCFAKCSSLIMDVGRLGYRDTMDLMERCAEREVVPIRKSAPSETVMSVDALLWAIRIIRGDAAMAVEAARIGLSRHRLGTLDSASREEVADLCDAFDVDLTVVERLWLSRPDVTEARVSKAMQLASERWWKRPVSDVAAEDPTRQPPTHLSG